MSFKNLKIFDRDLLWYLKGGKPNCSLIPKIAIIGNAGVTQQDNEKIDQADVVVRFNNFATRERITHSSDRFRCDVLFTTTDLHSNGSRPSDVVIGIPSPFKQDQVLRNLPRWYPESRYWMVNPYENYRLCQELELQSDGSKHPLPSIGFTALWHMRDWTEEIYIGGFNWYVDLQKDTVQNKPIDPSILPSNFNHFYIKELAWIIKHLKPKKNILFSDACLKILNHVEKKIA